MLAKNGRQPAEGGRGAGGQCFGKLVNEVVRERSGRGGDSSEVRRVESESRNRVIYALLKHLTVNKSMKSSRTRQCVSREE